MRDMWDRSGWLFSLLVLSTVVVCALYWNSLFPAGLRTALCASDPGENCVREWFAAASGWAAVLVAVPTLIYLKRQIHDAKEAAQSAFALQNYGNVVLCHKLLRDSRMLQEEVIIQRLVWGPAPSEQPRSIETAIDTVSQLRESLAIKSFLQFEDAIGYPKDLNFVDVGSILDMAEATIRRAPSPLNGDEARAIDRSVREMYDVIERYVADCIHAAKSYISDTDRIAGVHGFHPRATILENWPL